MSINFRYPNITAGLEKEQITQVKAYLHQLVDQLNYAFNIPEKEKQSQTGSSDKIPAKSSVDTAEILKACYPVGAVYISTVSTNPSNIFGFGTWERIEDRFLLAAGSTYAAGSTGGEAEHILTVEEMPSHKHGSGDLKFAVKTGSTGGTSTNAAGASSTGYYTGILSGSTASVGDGVAHNNMPPYITVYMWKRVG